MKLIRYILYFVISISLLASCKTSKQTPKTVVPSASQIQLKNHQIKSANFNNITINISINGSSLASRASMRIITDSVIQISIVPALGIEMARINFTPDSILLLDKINQKYLATSYDSLLNKINLPLGFSDLQAFFLNKLFVAGQNSVSFEQTLAQFNSSSFPDGLMLRSKTSFRGVNSDFVVNKQANINMATIMFPAAVVRCKYSEFETKDNIDFPQKLSISFMQGPIINQAEISISQVDFNKAVRINPVDLSNYTQVKKIEQIIPN